MQQMRKPLFTLLLIAFSAPFSNAQIAIDTERIPPEHDSNDLYRRAAASRFVVIGTVVKTEGIAKRLSQSDVEKMKRPTASGTHVSLDGVVGGSLYTVEVENTLCRESDFRPSATQTNPTKTVSIFLPRDEPMFKDGHQRATLVVGQRYLLFVVPSPEQERQKWIQAFQLDPKNDYYRTEQSSRGVVPVQQHQVASMKGQSVLERVTKLCQALRPVELTEKLQAVRILARSDDPVLRREAIEAETALQAQTQPQ
jgi:hypothetical protein